MSQSSILDRKVILYIAMSLDGYIADKNGNVDWLEGQESKEENTDSYSEFVRNVDTVFMGYNTYHQVVTKLSPDRWIYADFKTYVITHRSMKSSERICFTDEPLENVLKEVKQEKGKDIWICGGAQIIRQLMEKDLIDQYYISVIPTILGSGIRLFDSPEKERKLSLIQTRAYNGIVEVIYERR